MNKLKILEVVDSYYPIVEGVVSVVDNYAQILNTYPDIQCDVLTCRYDPIVERGYKTIRVTSMPGIEGRRLPVPIFDAKLKKELEQTDYDLIHIHSPATLGKYAIKYGKKHNIPTIITSHTRYQEEINRTVKLKSLQKMGLQYVVNTIKSADYIWAPSDCNALEVQELYKIDKDVEVVRNGTDISNNCSPSTYDAVLHSLQQQHGIQDDDKIMLFVGRIVPVKNLDILIHAMPKVKQHNPQCKLLIVGDGVYRAQLEDMVAQLDIADVVKFVGMVEDRETLTAYYKLAHLFAFPSTFDTGSLTIRESVALSLPVLVVDNCSSSEEIIDNVNSYVADNSSVAWADKILDIFSDNDRHLMVQTNCYTQLYRSWHMAVDNVLARYRQIIAQHPDK